MTLSVRQRLHSVGFFAAVVAVILVLFAWPQTQSAAAPIAIVIAVEDLAVAAEFAGEEHQEDREEPVADDPRGAALKPGWTPAVEPDDVTVAPPPLALQPSRTVMPSVTALVESADRIQRHMAAAEAGISDGAEHAHEATNAAVALSPPMETVAAVVDMPVRPSHVVQGEAALRRVRFDLSSVGYTISFHRSNATHRGLTFTQRRHIEVYVRPGMTESELAYVIGHEMGHAVDHIRNSNADRLAWRTARGISPSVAWWPTGLGDDTSTPAGDFSECFASWAVGSPSHSAWGGCSSVSSLMAQLAAS